MQLKINEKDIMNCSEEDIAVLINNPDFRENEGIEYKLTFSHIEGKDYQDKEEKRAEYKCDVCSFANADGGYLIYGIAEDNGCASSIIGIDIPDDDTDKFKLLQRFVDEKLFFNNRSSSTPTLNNLAGYMSFQSHLRALECMTKAISLS